MPAPDQPLLVAQQIGFTFPDGRVLLHDLNLALGPGRTALVGANGIGPPGAAAPLFRDLTFSVRGPQRWAIRVPNGSGKSTLPHLLAGELKPGEGRHGPGRMPPRPGEGPVHR